MYTTPINHEHFWHQTNCEQFTRRRSTLIVMNWECVLCDITFEQKVLVPKPPRRATVRR